MLETRLEKRALLIGVNKYPNLPDYSQLRGCVNDVLLMKTLLESSFGFPAHNIVALCDEKATVKGIRDAMQQLLDDCGPEDIVVFHYSGHGSQMAAQGDKPRGYDESIMPYDSGRMNPTFPKQVSPCDIRDTEIQEWLGRLSQKTSHITLIFDSCHSGSITRSIDDAKEGTNLRWIPPDLLPGLSFGSQTRSADSVRDTQGNGWLAASDKYIVLAACAADQGAYEMDHDEGGPMTRNGAFTFFLSQEIGQASENTTYQDIWERVAIHVNNRFQKQTPQIEGAGNRQLFDVKDFRPMRYLLVTKREGQSLTLNGGRVHGVYPESQWTVYPAGTKSIEENVNEKCGEIRIVSAGSLNSQGLILEECSPQLILAGARAIESSRPFGETLMPVWVEPTVDRTSKKLRDLLSDSNLLTLTDSPKAAWARVMSGSPNGALKTPGDDNEANNGEPTCDVLDRSNQLLMPSYSVRATETPRRIKENLELIWRYIKVLELQNPSSALRGQVDFVLLKKQPGGIWEEVDADEATFVDGDCIAFRVMNNTNSSIHVSILDFGISKRISLLYPPAGASEEIAPQRSGGGHTAGKNGGLLSVGEDPATTIELFLPHDQIAPAVQRGKEVFKAIITNRRHDLGFLRQSGLRNDAMKGPRHPLEQLIYLADAGGLTRESRLTLDSADEWFTIERSFWLQRKP
jgi:hypothetical protein